MKTESTLFAASEAEFDQAYAIMAASFPKSELRPHEEQRALLDKPEYRLLLLGDENGKPIGVAAVYDFPTVLFIEHLAVAPSLRGGGYGSKLLQMLMASTDKPLCLEVEHPDTEMAARRIGFYQRNRFFLNDYPYTQPPITRGQPPVELLIMSTGRTLEREEFEELKDLLYREVYHCK